MHDRHVSTRLGEASRAPAIWEGGSSEVAALELHASEGCSVCARALVNAREMAVDLTLAEAPAVSPAKGRQALLDPPKSTLDPRKACGSSDAPKARILDPSGVVATKHIHGPGEAARIAEIDALRANEPRPGESTQRMLTQLARFL